MEIGKYEQRFMALKIIHLALGGGVLMFFAVLAFLSSKNAMNITEQSVDSAQTVSILGKVAGFMYLGALSFSQIITKRIATQIEGRSIDERIGILHTNHIMRMAVFEGSSLLALVGIALFVLPGGNIFDYKVTAIHLGVFAGFIIMWAFHFPTDEKITDILKLREL